MAGVVVGGVTIPIAASGNPRDRSDATDRTRAFDNSYRVSQTGGAARDWNFTTPPISRALADTYEAQLAIVGPQLCSGDILGIPTMCCAEIDDPWTPVTTAQGHSAVISFTLHEVQPANVLLRYSPGDTITGESFTAATTRTYRDANGLVATAAIDVKRAAHYDINDLVANSPSLLLEDAATNIALQSRDLANAAWTKSASMTAARTSVGADGAANGATRLTAVGVGNQTATQAVVLASSTRFMSAYIKRIVGTGAIQMTTDGGGTWTTVTITAGWTRVSIPAQTVTNPNFGFRIVTANDAIDVDFVQNETGTFMTSAIPTTTAAVTRGADLLSYPFTTPPQEMTVYVKFIERGTVAVATGTSFLIANAASASPAFAGYAPAGFYADIHLNTANVTSTLGTAPVYNDTAELCFRLFGDGSVDVSQSINGGAVTTATQSAALALASAWSGLLFWPNGSSASARGYTAIKSIKVVAGARSLARMRTL